MENIKARILFENLIKRVRTLEDGSKHLGTLTHDEYEAMQIALTQLERNYRPDTSVVMPVDAGNNHHAQTNTPAPEFVDRQKKRPENAEDEPNHHEITPNDELERVDLDLRVLNLPSPHADVRLCLDFGTAMSKATLVHDHQEDGFEEIDILKLGVPGDQEEINEIMLISSVYIDDDGLLWFGRMAVERSRNESTEGNPRHRIDNIKRRLSEDGLDELVSEQFNPTGIEVTYGDMVLAYLMFLTWTVSHALGDRDKPYPRNLPRRFAMPCLPSDKARETAHQLHKLLGEAQILADTFFSTLNHGIPLQQYLGALKELRTKTLKYDFVTENITEPLGVAGSLLSWRNKQDMMVMVVDVGAGTSDFGLYRIIVDPEEGKNASLEIEGSSRGITEAGNHLDRILIELILTKAGVTSEDTDWISVRGALELNIRDYKETLFDEEFVFVPLKRNGETIEVELDLNEFLAHEAVQAFGKSLRDEMHNILESVDSSVIKWVAANPIRHLTVALTGGGAKLPMVEDLAKGSMVINGTTIQLARALHFPVWLKDEYEELEPDYPRIAVSLGGARKRLIKSKGTARVIGGDVTEPPKLGGYYMKGN